jgi:hypothetical protein
VPCPLDDDEIGHRTEHGKIARERVDMASVKQARVGLLRCGMKDRNTNTAGTLLAMFESTAANRLITPILARCSREAMANRSLESEVFSTRALR